MESNTKYKFKIEKTKTGYSVYEHKKPIFTTGKTIHEIRMNAFEASNLFLENSKQKVSIDNIEFEFDFKQFFAFYKIRYNGQK